MFTRVVEVNTKSGKAREVCNTIRDKALPILKNQNGFVDEVTLVSTDNPNRVLAISFWKTREDAQQYHNQQFVLEPMFVVYYQLISMQILLLQ